MPLEVRKTTILEINGQTVEGRIKEEQAYGGYTGAYSFYPGRKTISTVDAKMSSNKLSIYIKELQEVKDLVDAYNIAEKLEAAE